MRGREGICSGDGDQRPAIGVSALPATGGAGKLVLTGWIQAGEAVGKRVVAIECEAVGVRGAEVDVAQDRDVVEGGGEGQDELAQNRRRSAASNT